jgi:hypothetical protein
MLLQGIQGILLVGTELNHVLHCVWNYYSRKPSLVLPSGRFLKCLSTLSSTWTKAVYMIFRIVSSLWTQYQ